MATCVDALYITVDKLYGNMEDGFVVAQSWMNLVEVLLGFYAVAVRTSNAGVVIAFATSVMTFWKTVAYMSTDALAGFPSTSHNDWTTFATLYFLPSFVWLLLPGIAMVGLGQKLCSGKAKSA